MANVHPRGAAENDSCPKRIAENQVAYSESEFLEWFGPEKGKLKWENAIPEVLQNTSQSYETEWQRVPENLAPLAVSKTAPGQTAAEWAATVPASVKPGGLDHHLAAKIDKTSEIGCRLWDNGLPAGFQSTSQSSETEWQRVPENPAPLAVSNTAPGQTAAEWAATVPASVKAGGLDHHLAAKIDKTFEIGCWPPSTAEAKQLDISEPAPEPAEKTASGKESRWQAGQRIAKHQQAATAAAVLPVLAGLAPPVPSAPTPPTAVPLSNVTPPPPQPTDNQPANQVLQSTVSLPMLFSQAELQDLEPQITRLKALHEEARALLNSHADAPPTSPVDVSVAWRNWRSYVASHAEGPAIVGAGIAKVTVESVANTKDSNRQNKNRTDFFFHRVDGSAARVHPGSTRKTDAKVAEVSLVLQSTSLPVNASSLGAIPQVDRMSHLQALRRLWPLVPIDAPLLVDLTDESLFPWRLLLANVASALEAIGNENVEEVCLVHPSTDGDLVTLRITAGSSPPHVHHLQLHPRFNKDGVLVKAKALLT